MNLPITVNREEELLDILNLRILLIHVYISIRKSFLGRYCQATTFPV